MRKAPKKNDREPGELQAAVMQIVWERGQTTVREVHAVLSRRRPIAYTTVMTVMSRLAARKLLRRRKDGASYVYRAAQSRDEMAGEAIVAILSRLAGGIGTPVLSHFVDAVGSRSPEKLDELAGLIEAKKKGPKR
ncbi:MAG TPA: BlaI/MecI/CopY family transcriptional regulator [Thermoanaerobaculia bacterium]|nr:BlaI/MecI/CopY family transcriptional regulator [Thermoanaerobaculia bacterium]